ncbi:MAG: hypothetical protein JNL47_01855 [Bacteroidia bacterium]|nr:hypothetical protein [Bacteroidia bacterium]
MIEFLGNHESKQSKEVWKYLQAFLAHAGILGSLVFKKGNPEKTKIVTDFLISELELNEDSPIRERGGRNFLEHIEVFEIYVANRTDDRAIIQMVFNDRKGFDYLKSNRYYYKRTLILDEMVFAYQNQEYINELELKPIADEIKRIFKNSDIARKRMNIIER